MASEDSTKRDQGKLEKPKQVISSVNEKIVSPMNEKGALLMGTLLRIGVGAIMTVHGSMKLANLDQTVQNFAGMGIPLPELSAYLAMAGELLGGIGLLLGLLTRIAALGPVCTMIGAIAFVHIGNGLLAKNGGWEYPLTLLLVSAYFVFRGGGPFSVDQVLRNKGKTDEEKRAAKSQPTPGWRAEAIHRSM